MTDLDRAKPRSMYVDEAIALALEGRWEEALAVNRTLLERHEPDDDTYNRIGKALSELGQHQEALDAYTDALRLNPLNPIAHKNSRKLTALLEAPVATAGATRAIDVDLFAEEPGRSGLAVLVPPAQPATVAIAPGDPVELEVDGPSLRVRTESGVLLGRVEAKLSRRLLPLMATGNRYAAAVARLDPPTYEVMIREVHQSSENSRRSSFPISRTKVSDFRPYAKESLLVARELAPDAGDDGDDEGAVNGVVTPDVDGSGDAALTGDLDEPDSLEDEEEDVVDDDIRPEDEY